MNHQRAPHDTSDSLLPGIELNPPGEASASVIWLHGLGADGHDFEPIVPELNLDPALAVRFVFPHAPVQPVTINNGIAMRAWYDIRTPDLAEREDEEGLRQSSGLVEKLIEREISRGVAAERIVLAGFSQGGAVALHLGLRYPRRLAGILALSTYLVAGHKLAGEAHQANRDTPVFMGHGNQDPVVPEARGKAARDLLTSAGHPVEWHSYPMPHAVIPAEIRDIGAWLAARLSD